jgi:hypothetical protein
MTFMEMVYWFKGQTKEDMKQKIGLGLAFLQEKERI